MCDGQGMLLMCPLFDDVTALQKHSMTSGCMARICMQYTLPLCFYLINSIAFLFIVLSCLFALGVNISNYLVLGKTSPLTYQVLGHLKTVLILVLGFTVFNVSFIIGLECCIFIVC